MTGAVLVTALWSNLHLLFWLSLTPFTSAWMGESHFAPLPVAVYGAALLMCGGAMAADYVYPAPPSAGEADARVIVVCNFTPVPRLGSTRKWWPSTGSAMTR